MHFFNANVASLNSISQCVLKLTVPGVPDIYQGSEIFKFCMVDPDNRQPVDYQKISKVFDSIQLLINFNPEIDNFEQILSSLNLDAMKLFYTATILNFRNQNSDLFKRGEYIPLNLTGKNANHFIAFARLLKNQAIIVIVPRLVRNLISKENPLQINQEMIDDTTIELPLELEDFYWTDIFTKRISSNLNEKISLRNALEILPISVLYGDIKI